jgi:hypothetical protein
MHNKEKDNEVKNVDDNLKNILPKVSMVTFDEKTGTVTLKIASEEEIAEAEKLKMRNEK